MGTLPATDLRRKRRRTHAAGALSTPSLRCRSCIATCDLWRSVAGTSARIHHRRRSEKSQTPPAERPQISPGLGQLASTGLVSVVISARHPPVLLADSLARFQQRLPLIGGD